MAILVTHLIENLTDHSKIPRSAENKHDLCRQGFGITVMWHFCLYSDGKHYIIHKCCSLWQAIYQRKGSQQHSRGAQVFVPRRAHAGSIYMSWFPFQTSSAANWSTRARPDHFQPLPVKRRSLLLGILKSCHLAWNWSSLSGSLISSRLSVSHEPPITRLFLQINQSQKVLIQIRAKQSNMAWDDLHLVWSKSSILYPYLDHYFSSSTPVKQHRMI